MGLTESITQDDIATARAVYSRRAGSKSPDKDPNPKKWLKALMGANGTKLSLEVEVCDIPIGPDPNLQR